MHPEGWGKSKGGALAGPQLVTALHGVDTGTSAVSVVTIRENLRDQEAGRGQPPERGGNGLQQPIAAWISGSGCEKVGFG